MISQEVKTGAMGKRPSICALNDGNVVVAFDNWSSIGMAYQTTPSRFSIRQVAYSSKITAPDAFNASRLYVPSIATDGNGVMIAWRCGIKEWGSEKVYGPAVSDGINSRSAAFCKGAARCAYDPVEKRYFVLSKDGACRMIMPDLYATGKFDMPIGSTGEKLAFAIGPDGVRHAVMSGYSKQGSSYVMTGGKRVEWAAHRAYPDMSPDENYPGIGLMNKTKAIVGAVYGGQLRYNVIIKGVPKHDPANLPSLGAARKGDRMGPSFVRAGWGMLAFWQQGASVAMGRIGKPSQTICEGEMPCGVWNAVKGCVSLAYVRAGAICVREIREG